MGDVDIHATARYFLQNFPDEIKKELINARQYKPVNKDILVVVHDQLECVVDCISSIRRHTKDYKLYLWDNGSKEETARYLQKVATENPEIVYLHRENDNLGFIVPNNRLVSMGTSAYVILLNSDTIVRHGWDEIQIAWLQTHPEVALVGCMGGMLDENMVGTSISGGDDVDYICGWSMCFPRSTYEQFGLFDEVNLQFAYGEDSDFSLRIKESGRKIYAMYSDLVLHLTARTSLTVANEKDISVSFQQNHAYLKQRWGSAGGRTPLH